MNSSNLAEHNILPIFADTIPSRQIRLVNRSYRSATRARVFLHDNLVVGGKACKVRKSTRTKTAAEAPLPVSKCEELANHFLGFNGWSSELIYHRLEEVSPDGEWTYCCAVRLTFRCVPGLSVEGVGMAVASVDDAKPETKAPSIAIARKQSKTAAKINAFSKVQSVSRNLEFII